MITTCVLAIRQEIRRRMALQNTSGPSGSSRYHPDVSRTPTERRVRESSWIFYRRRRYLNLLHFNSMVMQTGDMSDGDLPLFALSRREGHDKVGPDRLAETLYLTDDRRRCASAMAYA
jgi:hypothetical protein